MNSWKVIVATIVIFGAGVFSGGLLVNYVDHSRAGNRHAPVPPRAPEELVPRPEILKTNFVQRLDDAVHLTSEQRDKIEKIVADGQERNRKLWAIVSPQMRDAIQETRQHIREVLTPEQKKQFEELFKRPRRQQNSTNAPPNVTGTNSPPVAPMNAPAN